MLRIFNDERHKTGPIWPNPEGTRSIWPLDVVAKTLKLRIFNDERHKTGPIWPNPEGTRSIWPLDVVAKTLKCPALRHFPRLTSDQIGHAGDTS